MGDLFEAVTSGIIGGAMGAAAFFGFLWYRKKQSEKLPQDKTK